MFRHSVVLREVGIALQAFTGHPGTAFVFAVLDTCEAAMEGLERLRAKFTIDLHPSRLASPTEGVRAHLSSLLLRYSEDLEGVLLSYRNERVLTQAASIHPYFPFVRVEVAADVVLFRPCLGMRLVGTVNKVGADYIGVLVLGFMNAAIAADAIRPEFRPRLAEHCWASTKAAAHRLEAGTKVHFDVQAVRHHGAFVSIAGSLQQPGTGAEGFARPPKRPAEAASGGKQQRRQQQVMPAATAQVQQQQQQEADQPSSKKDKKKKKKRQQEEAAPAMQQQQQVQEQQGQQQEAAPQEAAARKKAKKSKRQGEQAAAAPAEQAPAPAPPVAAPAALQAADGSQRKPKSGKKDKKRKAEDAPTPAAAAAAVPAAPFSTSVLKPQRKKKKRMADA